MRSRMFSLILSVLIFISSIQIIGFTKSEAHLTEGDTAIETKVETIVCNFKDIAYGSNKNQTFDLNLPVDDRDEIGLVVFLHGGGWAGGNKTSVKRSLHNFDSNEDYATASINYRLAGEENADIYDIIDDITAALELIKNMAGGYGMNITKLVICGHSAGGHLSLLYAYKYKDISPIPIVGVYASASVPDLSVDAFYTKNTIGDEAYMCSLVSKVCGINITPENRARYKGLLDKLSPVNYVDHDTVPTILMHGLKDSIAPFSGAAMLDDVLTENRVNHELISVESVGHGVNKRTDEKTYAENLLAACIKEWFDLKPTKVTI